MGIKAAQNKAAQNKPALLMLCHCVPDPVGHTERARAWQLLKLTGQHYRVFLATIADGPVNLTQWRAAQQLVERISLHRPAPFRRIAGAGLGWLNEPSAEKFTLQNSLSESVQTWTEDVAFDTVLCTHPALWPQARSVAASKRICDLYRPMSFFHHRLTHSTSWGRSLWRQSQLQNYQRAELQVARESDIITVVSQEAAERFQSTGNQTVLLPDAIDLSYFDRDPTMSPANDSAQTLPRLVFHADRRLTSYRRGLEWFTRRVWPQIQQAMPGAQLDHSDQAISPDPLGLLRNAWVVVSPVEEPQGARWPILQAMALQRPVIAPRQAVRGMAIRHGEHLLLTNRDQDWAELCIESLQSASIRLRLAHGARAFIENYCPIERSGRALIKPLMHSYSRYDKPCLAKAA